MIGGAGDDTYYIQSPGDVVFESSGADTYVVYFDWMEPLPQDIDPYESCPLQAD